MNIVIIGAGRIGMAFKYMCEKNGAPVELCDVDTAKAPEQKPLTETVPIADIIFLCTQSFAIRNLIAQISPLLQPHALVVSAAKGIERTTLKTIDQVMAESIPSRISWGIIIGPTLAEEIVNGQGSAAVFAGNNPERCASLTSVISRHDMTLECSSDLRGVALAGVLKNVYALGLGIADGLGWGANRKGWLVTHALVEMRVALGALGGNPVTAKWPGGLGDLVATGSSAPSRNRTSGEQLVRTGTLDPLSEGYISLASIKQLLGDTAREFALFSAIVKIVDEKKDARESFESLV